MAAIDWTNLFLQLIENLKSNLKYKSRKLKTCNRQHLNRYEIVQHRATAVVFCDKDITDHSNNLNIWLQLIKNKTSKRQYTRRSVIVRDAARPLSYKTKTTYILKTKPVMPRPRPWPLFQDQDRFFKDHQIINQRTQKRSLTEKIRPVMPIFPSHAGIMPVTEKTLIITGFLIKF